ncbi:hypothetical protein Tco_0869580, partial [Tanacetum coccineum]
MEKIIDAEENDNIACAELTLNRFKNSGNGKRPVDGVADYEMLKERVMNFHHHHEGDHDQKLNLSQTTRVIKLMTFYGINVGNLIMKVSKRVEVVKRHWRVWNCDVLYVGYAICFQDVTGLKTIIKQFYAILAKAAGLIVSAYQMRVTNLEAFTLYLREAAGMFESVGGIVNNTHTHRPALSSDCDSGSNSSYVSIPVDCTLHLKLPVWENLEAIPFVLDAALTTCAH